MNSWVRAGFVANLPVAASVAAYGSVLGVLAAQKNISWFELLLMNITIFAGSAQFVMVEMWTPPLPIFEITLAVLVMNLRYLLIGASLNSLFQGSSLIRKLATIHLTADENWAITMAAYRQGKATPAFLFGGGLCLMAAWCGGTLLGHRLGAVLSDPEVYALDFAFIAVFLVLALGLWRGKQDGIPWIVAAALAIVAERWLPGKWYILIGGVGGAFATIFRTPSQ